MQKAAKKRPRGRPRTGKVRMQVKLSRRARRLIRERAAKLGISLSEYIERAVLGGLPELTHKGHNAPG